MQKKILVVDDQAGIRLLLTDLFTSKGYHVTTATTGKEALDIINTNPFHLIIVDYRLPIFNGTEILDQLHQNEREIPAFLMSGFEESIREEAAQYSQVKAVLTKPFDVEEMVELVKSVIG
ncbi:response regulator [Virgibacillus sp. NKC19-16]|uniref:response regulator n=1 Tax=Virgibacillus salidurans TaxID=2831673 RepID=UPI001F44C703|nr:response regulator [Virgibacillus sp. NKC19-16]UJL46006.1 response regulator [Virgibacillus sp. NKC19-16]